MPFPHIQIEDFDSSRGDFAILIWRTGCSTSRMTVPFWQRLAERHSGKTVIAICQDSSERVASYAKANGLTLRQYADEGLQVTKLLGIRTVPSYWLVENGEVAELGVGWDRGKMERIDKRLGGDGDLFTEEDRVPAMQPG